MAYRRKDNARTKARRRRNLVPPRRPGLFPNTLPAVDAIKKGHVLWQGSLPKRCVDVYRQEPWRCYFGYRLYPTIKAPLFVFQWLFDEAQMTADNVGSPSTPQQWDYIHRMGNALRASFANVSAVFAPSCVSHSVLTTRHWLQVKVDRVSVADALHCWDADTARRRNRNQSKNSGGGVPARHLIRSGRRRTAALTDYSQDVPQNVRPKKLGDDNKELKRNKEPTNRQNNEPKNSRKNVHNLRRNPNGRTEKAFRENRKMPNDRERFRQRKRGHKRRKGAKCDSLSQNGRRHSRNRTPPRLRTLPEKVVRPQRSLIRKWKGKGKEACSHRHMERCSWPQCNRSCPLLLDPFTGEEVRFVDMLKSFGLEMDSVAAALGVDMHTLDNMDHATLLNLLTQQTN